MQLSQGRKGQRLHQGYFFLAILTFRGAYLFQGQVANLLQELDCAKCADHRAWIGNATGDSIAPDKIMDSCTR